MIMAYFAVALAWVSGMVCCTVLVLHDHPLIGLAVLIVGAMAQTGSKAAGELRSDSASLRYNGVGAPGKPPGDMRQ